MAFSGFSINLVLVGKKIATRTLGLSDMHATQGTIFWRAGILTERSAPPATESSQHRTKEVKPGTIECKQQI